MLQRVVPIEGRNSFGEITREIQRYALPGERVGNISMSFASDYIHVSYGQSHNKRFYNAMVTYEHDGDSGDDNIQLVLPKRDSDGTCSVCGQYNWSGQTQCSGCGSVFCNA